MTDSPSERRPGVGPAIAVWLLGCALLGYGCFVFLGRRLTASADRFWAAVWWQLSFAVALAVILFVIVRLQAARGESLRELGWRKPATKTTLIAAVLLGLLYAMGVYAGIHETPAMKDVNPYQLHWIRFVLVPVGVFMASAE